MSMNDQTGMNTSYESPAWSRIEPNVPVVGSELSSYEIDELFLQATTALQKAVQAAYKVRAREDILKYLGVLPMTPDPEAVSPFTQRLMLYYGLIATIAGELRSIAPMPPAMDAGDSSKVQESPRSSTRAEPFARIDTYTEPPYGSIVLDHSGDAWQRRHDGWSCAVSDSSFRMWDWDKLRDRYSDLRLIRWGNDN